MGNGIVLSAGYIHNSTWNLQRRLDRNLFAPTISNEGMPIFPKERPNTSIGKYSVSESSAHSSYDAFILTITSSMAKRLNFQANYTLGRTVDDDSNERAFNKELAMNPFDLSIERGYSKQDVRHAFNLIELGRPASRFHFQCGCSDPLRFSVYSDRRLRRSERWK